MNESNFWYNAVMGKGTRTAAVVTCIIWLIVGLMLANGV